MLPPVAPISSKEWAQMLDRITVDPSLSRTNKTALLVTLRHVGSGDRDVTQQTVANEICGSLRTAKRAIAWLVTNGYLLRERCTNARGFQVASAYSPGPRCHRGANSDRGATEVPPVAQQKRESFSSVVKSVDQVRSSATDERHPSGLVCEVPEAVPGEHPHPLHADVGLDPREVPSAPPVTAAPDLRSPLACPDPGGEESTHPPASAERLPDVANPPTHPMSAYEDVLDRLERVRRSGKKALASCPVASHGKGQGDREPSLSVTEGEDKKVLLHCMGGCHVQDVMVAAGLDWHDLFDGPITNDRGVKVAEWTYQARDGSPWLTVERWQTPQGKRFVQRIPGAKETGLPRNFRPALFKLPKVLAAAAANEEIFVVEGEKCVAAAELLGVTATTAPAGVNGWRDYYSDWLKGAARVTIICDNDEPGMRYASAVAASLKGKEIPVRTMKVAVSAPKADIYDHVLAGYGLADLVPVKLNQFRPDGMCVDKLAVQVFPPVEWVIRDLMPIGFTVLGGAPKVGKSFVALDAGMNVGLGGSFLHTQQCEQGSVLYLSLDNDALWRLQLRMKHLAVQYGVDPVSANIEFHTDFPIGEAAIKGIAEWCSDQREAGRKPLMVVVDTIAKAEPHYEGREGGNGYLESTSNLSKWSQLALDQRIGILGVHHVRKSGDDDWMNRYIGSQGIAATATTLMMIDTKRGSDEGMLLVSSRDAGDHQLEMVRAGWSWHLKEPARGENIVTRTGLELIHGGLQ